MGLYEAVLHATGWYPSWWEGRRFGHAPNMWICGDSGKTLRDILQMKLLGPMNAFGTGTIPAECIIKTVRAPGVAEFMELIYVKHVSGGTAVITFKSYESGINAFMGTAIDYIQLDEEPPREIYTECLIRTMTCNGSIVMTFTPLLGMSDVVMMYLVKGKMQDGPVEGSTSKFVVTATWDDAPHLTQRAKDELWASIPAYQRDARSKGIPQLGAGAIYPIGEHEIVCAPFTIPDEWRRWYGLDVGWNKTAAVWLAEDPESKTIYAYSEYYRGQAEPDAHSSAIKARGRDLPGFIDPASCGSGQLDGKKLINEYKNHGLDLSFAANAVEAGITCCYDAMVQGRLKIFASLSNLLGEYRMYRRDENGKVVKKDDHLLDALRYGVFTGTKKAKAKGKVAHRGRIRPINAHNNQHGWMN